MNQSEHEYNSIDHDATSLGEHNMTSIVTSNISYTILWCTGLSVHEHTLPHSNGQLTSIARAMSSFTGRCNTTMVVLDHIDFIFLLKNMLVIIIDI